MPPRLLRGRHVQSTLGNISLRRHLVNAGARELVSATEAQILDCGDGVRLLAMHTPPLSVQKQRVAVLIHGWEGSASSTYLLSAASKLWREGYRIIRLNLRDHGDSHHLNEKLFHSCRLDEVVGAIRQIQKSCCGERLYLCGFSLGGNFCLRIAALADKENLDISGVVAICPVLDPVSTMAALDNGAWIYRRYFINKWRASLEKKKKAFPHHHNFSRLERFNRLTEMTDYFVCHFTEYTNLDNYLHGYALTDGRMEHLQTPARILLAEDDPIIPVVDIDRVVESDYLQVDRSRYGGHCGFISGYNLHGWADDYIVEGCADYSE